TYVFIFFIITFSVFYWKNFPICFIDGKGLTSFKKNSEYIICFILLIDIILLFRFKDRFEKNVFKLLVGSNICTIISELAFTFYISNYGFSNLIGHYFKIFSFYMIYKAIVETGIVKPYDIIFRELKIKEKNLKQARDAAEVANKAKSEFLANMSHELRTPLNGILGYAQILKIDSSLNKSQQAGLDVIERSGTHLLSLINEILDLSKIEARKMEIHESVFNFPVFLRDIVSIINVKAKQKNIKFYSEISSNIPENILADEKRLGQILLNLMSNAVKFTHKGKIVFTVKQLEDRSENTSENTSENISESITTGILFQIEDTGIGISKEQMKDIFSPFKQVGEFSRTIEGTGLGLSISQKLVRMMGSELHVKSSVGKGSIFGFELDMAEVSETLDIKKSVHKKIIGVKSEKKKILVVDDKQENRGVLLSLLSPLGFEIMEASDGEQGFDRALEFMPDLVFMDLVMPKIDGFEATRKIRQSPKLKHVKVVAVSASTSLSPQEIIGKSNFNGFIPKPVQLEEIFKSLETHLSLEWLYEDLYKNQEKDEKEDNKQNKEILLPPLSDMETLYKSLRGGDIVALRRQLDDLENKSSQYTSFVKQLKDMAATFQLRRIRELLEEYMGIKK
ncbi:MASE3 domain-containing protein, partial [Desulfobacterales bacterium HSG17]|nr:MASE3 domain-containing protein [Desulfobacterales bacterium HSG17]